MKIIYINIKFFGLQAIYGNSRPCRTSGRDFFSKIVFNFLELLYYLFYAYNTDYISLNSDFITSYFDFLH